MSLLPLTLGVRRLPHVKAGQNAAQTAQPVKQKSSRALSADWPRLRDTVLKRDKYSCRYCGFRAEKFQRVHFAQGQVADLRPDNLVTACIFCEQCFELESVTPMHSGTLIWLPEMTQAELNHLARALYIARFDDNEAIAQKAQRGIDQLLVRQTGAKDRLGTHDPHILATAMIERMDDEAYEARSHMLEGIKLLPLANRITQSDEGEVDHFLRIRSYWKSSEGPFAKHPIEKWAELFPHAA